MSTGGRECADPPAEMLHNVGAEENDDEGRGADERRVVAHKNLVLFLVGVRLLHHLLPDDLGEVDGQAVANDQDAEIAQVLLRHEELERLDHAHLRLLLLGLPRALLGLIAQPPRCLVTRMKALRSACGR